AFSDENMNLQGKAERFKNISIVSEILETDENGFAEVDIKLPNYFGAMKIFVVAVSDDKFGSAEKTLTIKAPVIIEASAPRVLKVGDKFVVPITLFPIEDSLGNAKFTVKYEGKELSKEINFPNKEAQKFFFDLNAPEFVGETKIEVSYDSKKYNFKDTININVDSPYPQQYINSTKVLKAGEEFKINGNEFKDFIASSLNAELNLSSYENLGLYKVISSLLDYPYICLEQTTSKGIAMLAITKLTNDENELNLAKNSLNTIIKKLFNNYQQSDGSFSYWPGTNGIDTYATSIYTTEFLVEARKQGYYVPDEMYNRALNYIKSLFNRTDIVTASKVDALYVLAMTGEANISEMNIIFDKYYKNLPNFVKWVLLDTYNLIGEKDFAKNEANKLKIYSDDNLDSIYFNAKILKHYISIYGERSQELFKELLNVIKSDTWLSTYTQANIISALSKSVKNIERKNLSFVIDENGMKKDLILVNGQFNLKDINRILKEHRNITIKNTSTDNLYLNFLVKGKPIKFTEKDESNNIVLKREFLDMNGAQIDPKNLKVGDRFTLVIQSELKNLDFIENLALVQILPSGWELAPEFNNDSYFNYIDKRDDRIAFFYGQNKHETKEIRIDINVVTPGEYYLPGISVEAMYDNNIRAYLKGFNIKVNK
ncbi:alpha-2-macroglobulin family protein, partial [Fusobacterium sp.]|uniref:alpha-2-macroglobulin family protein n=1 Tax=Fusobacterium sp. TaxID=68766 RepID=UPI0025C5EFCD